MMSAYFLKSTDRMSSTSAFSASIFESASVSPAIFSRTMAACSDRTCATSAGVSSGISRFLMSSRENPRCFRDSIWWSLIMSLSVYSLRPPSLLADGESSPSLS